MGKITIRRVKSTLIVLLGALQLASLQAPALELAFAPVSGSVTSPFGWRVDPMNGSKRFHGGLDIAARSGMPVYAPQAGTVAFSGYHGGYGNVVVLNHGNSLYTLYGHNSRLLVQTGQSVGRGQVISHVGSTGRSTGPHLHFEVHYNGQYVNPLTYLGYLQKSGQSLALSKFPSNVKTSAGRSHHASHAVHVTTIDSPGTTIINPVTYKRKARRTQTVQLVSGTDVQNIDF